jgi:hypothetical protein
MLDSNRDFFDTLARVLLRCWIFGFLFLFFWFGVFLAGADFIYRVHGGIFGLSKHEMDLIFYCGMGLLKLVVIVLFFCPWVAIRLVLRKR